MCDTEKTGKGFDGSRTIPVDEAVGMVLAHDVTEIRQRECKGAAFRKGHVVTREDIDHLRRLGKERLYVLDLAADELHEDDAARALARALMGEGVAIQGEPREGKIDLIAERDGLLKVDREALTRFNMLGEVMCATLHNNTFVRKGRRVAGTRAIPLVVGKEIVDEAVLIAKSARGRPLDTTARAWSESARTGIIEVRAMRKPRVGVVITGSEVYHGRIQDAFGPIVRGKVEQVGGKLVGMYYAPDDALFIEARLRELLDAGADLLMTTGGMSVDPDDVTRFAIRNLGVHEVHYGSPVLPGAMVLVAYVRAPGRNGNGQSWKQSGQSVPVLGIPACGMYHNATVLDLLLPRVLCGEHIGRRELAEMGHGGMCLHCEECRFPVCPFGK